MVYLELYYNQTSSLGNTVKIEALSLEPSDGSLQWVLINPYEKTEESVEGTSVISSCDLVTKDRNVVTNSDLELLGDITVLLPTTDKTGNHTVPDLSKYRFLLFSLRGTTNGGWHTSTIFPTKLFRARGCEVIVESNNLDASFVYVSDTTINLNRVATNRGASVYGIK